MIIFNDLGGQVGLVMHNETIHSQAGKLRALIRQLTPVCTAVHAVTCSWPGYTRGKKSIQGGFCTGQSLRAACRLTVEWIQSDVLAEIADTVSIAEHAVHTHKV